ncbi:MAG: hypothetical protein HOI23_22885 [Deltaproteobacteria bacterium]|jgi:hypothetical protein|nr:hypothetical protein [Deltaproteobacteria bacterium]
MIRIFLCLFLAVTGCSKTGNDGPNQEPTNNNTSDTVGDTTDESNTTGETQDPSDTDTPTQWGELSNNPAQTFFASDLSEAVRDGVNHGLQKAAEAWGNYGPLEYWVLGTESEAGLALITEFCERRESLGQWSLDQCMDHHTRADSDHNFMSYLALGQQVVAENTPMGSMGRNGNRDWGIHLFTSSYPFGFDGIFEGIIAEEEIKTLFHEYFHAVQHAHIFTMDYDTRDQLLGPTWFVEGGAEFMAEYTTAKLWAQGELFTTEGASFPTLRERMEWKLIGGKQNRDDNCPGKQLAEIDYGDACSYAAYELGAWGNAYLQHRAGEDALLQVFLPSVENLGWETAFEQAFGMSADSFYADFEVFLELPLQEQLAILPTF